jgi:hypothetical protein
MSHALIVLLVLSPIELPLPDKAPEPLWQALKDFDQMAELSGPNAHWMQSFRGEARWARCRWREAADYPSICDCQRLPSLHVINQYLMLNRRYYWWLESRQRIDLSKADLIGEAMCETDKLYCIWNHVQGAMSESSLWVDRRRELFLLRQEAGDAAYYGRLPPPVPLWRYPH